MGLWKLSESIMSIRISVIIPTHNRRASLLRTVAALCQQTLPPSAIELIVVADGCTDDTVAMVQAYPAPFAVQVLQQSGLGAAAARNAGAAQASAPLLLFLDDDIEPRPTLLAAHLAAHAAQPGCVGIGAYPPVLDQSATLFQSQLQGWWEEKFAALGHPGHRFTYRDLLSGNLSLSATLFHAIGGFDASISDCGGEDYELGVRLLQANYPFVFIAEAVGDHYIHETTNCARAFQRARQEGRVDVHLGQRYPALTAQLTLAAVRNYRLRARVLLRWGIFQWPGAGEQVAAALQGLLTRLERHAFYTYWQQLYRLLYSYWYWRGVADKLGAWSALMHFTATTNDPAVEFYTLDLQPGLPAARAALDKVRPQAIRLYYGDQPIGSVPPQPGAEHLRGAHLSALLSHELAASYLEALAIAGALADQPELDRYRLFQALRAKAPWFGPTKLAQMWYEQYSQWGQVTQPPTPAPPNWAEQRKAAYESGWVRPVAQAPQTLLSWRQRLYQTLYRWHEPVYHWYTSRGWQWPTQIRERLKQILVHETS